MRPLLAAAVLLSLMPAASAQPAAGDPRMASVKAAFVFNLMKLVTWPETTRPSPRDPVNVCMVRGEAMEQPLRESLSGKFLGARPVELLTLPEDAALEPCSVLYLGRTFEPRYGELMARASERPILVVDEGERFSWPDGMVRLYVEGNRVRFELNPTALERSQLSADPRLVRLARIVSGPAP